MATARSPAPRAAARIPTIADRETPLVRNSWYVAGWSEEFTRDLQRRWILDQDVLCYRTAAGEAVALQNRCAHRSFPLHRGKLEGDHVVCMYHGITYAPDGSCIRVPSDNREATCKAIRLHRYPVVEQPPFVWIWTGETAHADTRLVPQHPWLADSEWAYGRGYKHIRANYLGLHENLLDTTHFSFLHAGNVGTPGYAEAPIDLEHDESTVRIQRMLANSPLPALYDQPMKLVDVPVDRYTDSNFTGPGWHAAHARVVDRYRPGGTARDYRTEILHAITPESQYTTHYWWAIARDYHIDEADITRYMEQAIIDAFEEDKAALEWIDELAGREYRPDFRERSRLTDRGGLQMRRIVANLARAEDSR